MRFREEFENVYFSGGNVPNSVVPIRKFVLNVGFACIDRQRDRFYRDFKQD